MPRGGARKGAGRKPVLNLEERWALGAQCEGLWQDEIRARRDAKGRKAYEDVDEEYRRVQASLRRRGTSWLRSEAGMQALADVEIARRERLGLSDDEVLPAVNRISAPRPKRLRAEIIAQVALASNISPRRAEACWKEFRQMARRVSA